MTKVWKVDENNYIIELSAKRNLYLWGRNVGGFNCSLSPAPIVTSNLERLLPTYENNRTQHFCFPLKNKYNLSYEENKNEIFIYCIYYPVDQAELYGWVSIRKPNETNQLGCNVGYTDKDARHDFMKLMEMIG